MMEKYITDKRTGIRYELVGDYYLPIDFGIKASHDVSVKESPLPARPTIGRFGRAHGEYLKRSQRHVYSQFVTEGKLGAYLAQIDEQANAMLDLLIRQMAEREGVTEQIKAADQIEWVRRMNSICCRSGEIVNSEMIYC